jgi:hypothetical protein
MSYPQPVETGVGYFGDRLPWREEPFDADRLVGGPRSGVNRHVDRLSLPKESASVGGCTRRVCPPRKTGFLALTFGTLLSSQGADAHRSGPFDPSRGNPLNLAVRVRDCQSDGLLTGPAAHQGHRLQPRASTAPEWIWGLPGPAADASVAPWGEEEH